MLYPIDRRAQDLGDADARATRRIGLLDLYLGVGGELGLAAIEEREQADAAIRRPYAVAGSEGHAVARRGEGGTAARHLDRGCQDTQRGARGSLAERGTQGQIGIWAQSCRAQPQQQASG
jgi:hypothetical protein